MSSTRGGGNWGINRMDISDLVKAQKKILDVNFKKEKSRKCWRSWCRVVKYQTMSWSTKSSIIYSWRTLKIMWSEMMPTTWLHTLSLLQQWCHPSCLCKQSRTKGFRHETSKLLPHWTLSIKWIGWENLIQLSVTIMVNLLIRPKPSSHASSSTQPPKSELREKPTMCWLLTILTRWSVL